MPSPITEDNAASDPQAIRCRFQSFSLRIGPLGIKLEGTFDPSHWTLDSAHHRFLSSSLNSDLALQLRYIRPVQPSRPLVFRLGSLASVHLDGSIWVFQVSGDDPESRPDRTVVLDATGTQGTLDLDAEQSPVLRYVYPLQYPLEELLFRHLLPNYGSVLLHACGIEWKGRGYLFVGSSGAGKSTTARLWKAAGATILNDDRTILEASPNGIRLHPTPWFGVHSDIGGEATALQAIYLLRKGESVSFEALPVAKATALLLAKSFPPLWDPGRLEQTLAVLERACRAVPCGWLTVPPDERAVAWVMNHS